MKSTRYVVAWSCAAALAALAGCSTVKATAREASAAKQAVNAKGEVTIKEEDGRVILKNKYVSVVVEPNGGMYVPEATCLITGKEVLHGLKLNFPYFEHGIKPNQTSGYRIIRNQNGSVTVAMNMRFCHHKGPKEIERHGRFAERSLSEFVTVRPGEAMFYFRGRVDNPTPLRRSNRLWDRYLLPCNDETRFIMPVSHGVEHSANWILPWPKRTVTDPATKQKVPADFATRKTWTSYGRQPTQYFALCPEYGFLAAYYPDEKLNRVRITDPVNAPGMKFYCAPGQDWCEPWGGTTAIFEDPGRFIDGFAATEMTQTYYAVNGIGEVAYADRNVAVSFEKSVVQVTSPRELGAMTVEVLDGKKVVAQGTGTLAPGNVVKVDVPAGSKRVAVRVLTAGETDRTQMWKTPPLPLEIKDTSGRYEGAKAACSRKRTDYIELQEHSNHRGIEAAMNAGHKATGLLKSGTKDVAALVSVANACYRIGDFEKALGLSEKALSLDRKNEHAFHVKGLIALERGKTKEAEALLAKAGVQAYYVRALMLVAQDDAKKAIRLLEKMIKARPNVYRPRLLLTWLRAKSGDADEMLAQAGKLAAENAAYPEAMEVLSRVAALAGDKAVRRKAGKAFDALLRNNPDAERQLALFRAELDAGQWVFVGRYNQPLPQAGHGEIE